jgi:hypothetical protein
MMTPVQAVEQLLVANHWLDEVSDADQWKSKDFDLSIVVSAVQQVSIPTLIADGSSTSMTVVPHGILPLCNALATGLGGLTGDHVAFDPSRKLFSVDFTWTSSKNTEVLAIRGVQVQFD